MENLCIKMVDTGNTETSYIMTKTETKGYKIVFDKRVISEKSTISHRDFNTAM